MWLLSLPVLALAEAIWLVRHPGRFTWLATLIGLGIAGLSYLFMYRGESPMLVFVTQGIGIVVYYLLRR